MLNYNFNYSMSAQNAMLKIILNNYFARSDKYLILLERNL